MIVALLLRTGLCTKDDTMAKCMDDAILDVIFNPGRYYLAVDALATTRRKLSFCEQQRVRALVVLWDGT